MGEKITLRDESGPEGSRLLELRRDEDGTIVLEGHDLGSGVAAFWGPDHREYEWKHTIPRGQDRKIREALGGIVGSDVLRLIRRWCAEQGEAGLVRTLEAHGVNVERSSWLGTDWD
jgi:hypothetical protein